LNCFNYSNNLKIGLSSPFSLKLFELFKEFKRAIQPISSIYIISINEII